MISLSKFLVGCKRNAARIKGYKQPYSGQNGLSDCIGYIIGALELEGQKWGGIHGSNYAERYRTKNVFKVTSASQLQLGQIVYKAYAPGANGYTLPEKYRQGGSMYNGDLNDYYHVGVVTSVNPLEISHCSTGGMHRDSKLGKWSYAGYCSLVDYSDTPVQPAPDEPSKAETGTMVVDVPDDTSVNVRRTASNESGILTRLPEGCVVNVTSTLGQWSHIEYSYDKTGEGYIMSKFLKNGVVDVPDDTSVNVRRQPRMSASRITTIPEGGTVTVLSNSGAWTKIRYSVNKSGTGYVMSKYLRKG